MDLGTQIAHLREDSEALLAAYRAAPGAPVPSCPGWDRAALLAHTGRVHGWVVAQMERGPVERVRFSATAPPVDGDALADWFATGAAELVNGLSTMDLAETWPTWAGPQPGTFFPRRMTHETAMHRRDADPVPFDPELASDGVDELLELFAPLASGESLERLGSIHLHATDIDGEWLVHLTPDGIRFEHGHAKGDVALRASAGDLLLWGWNRAPVDARFEVFGDASLLDVWRSAVSI